VKELIKKRIGVYKTMHDLLVLKPKNKNIIPVPVILAESKSFKEKMNVDIQSQNSNE
jgi:hypothetical protein